MTSKQHTTYLRVRYAETDAMGVVNNGRYLDYFEVGRSELMRASGYPYRELEKQGYLLPLRESHLRYYASARYDDLLAITARCTAPTGAILRIEYSIMREETLLVEGYTEHVFVKLGEFRPLRPPAFFTDKFFSNKEGE